MVCEKDYKNVYHINFPLCESIKKVKFLIEQGIEATKIS